MKRSSDKQSGVALIICLLALFALTAAGMNAIRTTVTDTKISGNLKDIKGAFYIAEAGISHAGEYLAQNDPNWLICAYTNPNIILNNITIDDGHYTVTIEAAGGEKRRVVSTGTTSSGAVAQIEAIFLPVYTTNTFFEHALFGNGSVELSGNGYIDSYDSSEGPWSGEGQDQDGNVGTNSTGAGGITLSGNAEVYGDAVVGAGGDPNTVISISGGASVTGTQSSLESPKDMTPVADPGGGTAQTLNIGGNSSKTFTSGTYRLPKIKITANAQGIISGDVVFYVDGDLDISGNGVLNILSTPASSLTIYVSGDIHLSGNGIANQSNLPENLIVYGTSTCGTVHASGNTNFYGAIYAPAAYVHISGNGDIFGAVVGDTAKISGNGNIHYDKNLLNLGTSSSTTKTLSRIDIISWRRI
ncbi:hypothetical protein JXL19_01070 [bacterium]|nr:hypothetical protein [bacterium]